MPRFRYLHFFILASLGFAIYSNTLQGPFQFDDIMYVLENPGIRDLENFLDVGGTRYVGLLSFALNYALGGYNPLGYHLANIVIHILNALFVYAIVILTFDSPAMKGKDFGGESFASNTAFASALIFIAHPVQTQAVSYITQRFASLATLFYLLAIIFFVLARLSQTAEPMEEKAGGKARTFGFYMASLFAAVIAQKTKEISFTLPLIIALYDFTFFNTLKEPWRRLLRIAPFLLTMLIIPLSLAGPYAAGGGGHAGVGEHIRLLQLHDLTTLSRHDYIATQFTVVITYLRLLLFPAGQNVLYDYPVFRSLLEGRVFFSMLSLSVIFGAALYLFIRSRRRSSGLGEFISFGIFWFFITLSTESSVIPIKHVIFEHRIYLPSIGIFMAFAAALFLLTDRIMGRLRLPGSAGKYAWVAVCIIVLSLSAATYLRNNVWGDKLALWKDVAKKSPLLDSSQFNLGQTYQERGDTDSAIIHYREALRLNPRKEKAHYNLALIYQGKGDTTRTIAHYREAIRLRPGNELAHYNLALIYQGKGDITRAVAHYREAIRAKPDYEDAHYNLAWTYQDTGDSGKAVVHYKKVIRLNPLSTDAHYNLGIIYKGEELFDDAIREFRSVLRIDKDYENAEKELRRALYLKGSETD